MRNQRYDLLGEITVEDWRLSGMGSSFSGNEYDMLGLFGSLKKAYNKIKNKVKTATKSLTSVVKQIGPVVATVYPPAGVALGIATTVVKAAEKGTPVQKAKAQKKISTVKVRAAQGDPKAIKSLDSLLAAQELIKQETTLPQPSGGPRQRTSQSAPPNLVTSAQTGQQYLLVPVSRR